MTQQPRVTRQSLIHLLNDPRPGFPMKVVGKALVVLLNRQTRAEAEANVTNVDNDIGFSANDARSGCITAKYFIKHGRLEDWQMERWTRPGRGGYPYITKYWRQLNDEATRKNRLRNNESNNEAGSRQQHCE